jgi:hypothetical protein
MNEVSGRDECQIHLDQFPAVIFCPALAALQQRLENLDQIEVSRVEVLCAANYLNCAVTCSGYYVDETTHELVMKRMIDETVGGIGGWGKIELDEGIIKPGRCDWYRDFLIVVYELKHVRHPW